MSDDSERWTDEELADRLDERAKQTIVDDYYDLFRAAANRLREAGEFADTMFRFLQGEPDEDGRWPHLLICSGSRRVPPGVQGTCCCRATLTDHALDDVLHGEAADRLRGGGEVERVARDTMNSLRTLQQYLKEGKEVVPAIEWHIGIEVRRLRDALDRERT